MCIHCDRSRQCAVRDIHYGVEVESLCSCIVALVACVNVYVPTGKVLDRPSYSSARLLHPDTLKEMVLRPDRRNGDLLRHPFDSSEEEVSCPHPNVNTRTDRLHFVAVHSTYLSLLSIAI